MQPLWYDIIRFSMTSELNIPECALVYRHIPHSISKYSTFHFKVFHIPFQSIPHSISKYSTFHFKVFFLSSPWYVDILKVWWKVYFKSRDKQSLQWLSQTGTPACTWFYTGQSKMINKRPYRGIDQCINYLTGVK